MARTRVYRVQLRAVSMDHAQRLITQLLYEIHFGAYVRTIAGPYTTGRLALSLKKVGPVVAGSRVSGRVGSDLPYAKMAHSGTLPHLIRPRRSNRSNRLRFFWRRVGRVVHFRAVNHPGQPGKRYLVEPLLETARRHGLRVTIYDI